MGFIPFFITNKLTQKVSLALREGRDTNAIEKDQANEKFAAKEHQNILSNDCYSEFNPSQRNAISENEKRIQDLCQKLTQCLYEQFQEKKSYDLETIEKVVQEVILQCATPEIDILFSKLMKEQNYEKRTFREQVLNLWESA
ncbi:MAG: hypothetical protein VKL42_10080 [Snowella sp.]|nr:hypothetical protein [Snowella sp.]